MPCVKMEEPLEMLVKEKGKQSSEGSTPLCDQPGTSRDGTEQTCQNLPCKENSRVTLVPQTKRSSYSAELFRTWRDIRWFQIPLSSLRRPKAGLFSFRFQSSLQEYQQLRKTKRLKVGRPFSVLPLPSLSVTLNDCCRETLHMKCGGHSRAGRMKRLKSSSARGAGNNLPRESDHAGGGTIYMASESQDFSRRMHSRLQKCRSSACSLSKRFVFCSGVSKQRQKRETRNRCRKKQKQVAHGCSEQDQASDAPVSSHLLSPGQPLTNATGSGEGTSGWASVDCPLEEEDDMFPADWSPPRIEFLYCDDPPLLSPAPGPVPESQNSAEMPDITSDGAHVGPQVMEFTAEPTSLTQSTLGVLSEAELMHTKNAALLEAEKRDVAGPEHLALHFSQLAEEELEGDLLVDQNRAKNWTDFGIESSLLSSPIHSLAAASKISSSKSFSTSSTDFSDDPDKMTPELDLRGDAMAASTVSSRSSISTSSDEFVEDPEKLTLGSDVERDMDPECPPLQLPTHLLMASPSISSRSSISTSSNKLSGDPEGMNPSSDMEEDIDDSSLISLRELLQTDDRNQNSAELSTFLSSGSDGYLSSLDKLLEEKREQIREDEELKRCLGEKVLLSSSRSSMEVVEENAVTFPESHRFLLKRFSIIQGPIPAVHPGESIFGSLPHLKTALVLDTAGLTPQNQMESLFFSSPFAQQMALLRDGFLTLLYCGDPYRCPHPVQRWLFQLMSLNSEVTADAFQALWEITVHQIISNDEVNTDLWFPNLKDITQAFYSLGACASALCPAGLAQLEFRPKDLEFLERLLGPAEMNSPSFSQEGSCQLTLAAMLAHIFKFLTLCVASHPHGYPSCQRLALLLLLCRLSLDRSLQEQPLLELQQLLLVLLEGIQDWQGKLLELCKSLCHVSQHHHNLVAIVRLFPDTTDRGRQLRRNLSLCFIAKLLGKMHMATSLCQEEIQLQQLGHLLPLMKPTYLKQDLQRLQKHQDEKEEQEALAELDQEACYLCYSLLTLANMVVGTKAIPSSKQGPLQHLCIQLQRHISASIREDPCIIYRTELKNLVAQTYVKWQELLSWRWPQGQS